MFCTRRAGWSPVKEILAWLCGNEFVAQLKDLREGEKTALISPFTLSWVSALISLPSRVVGRLARVLRRTVNLNIVVLQSKIDARK